MQDMRHCTGIDVVFIEDQRDSLLSRQSSLYVGLQHILEIYCALSDVQVGTFPCVIAFGKSCGLICSAMFLCSQYFLKIDERVTCRRLCALAGTHAPFSYAPVRGLRNGLGAKQHTAERDCRVSARFKMYPRLSVLQKPGQCERGQVFVESSSRSGQ